MNLIDKQMAEIQCSILIIGAGPAGATAAWSAVRAGARDVLLVDRAAWPRFKVCGSCLNPAGAELIERMGLRLDQSRGAWSLERVRLRVPGLQDVILPHPGGLVIERSHLDARLVDVACQRGAHFRHRTSARILANEGRHWRVAVQGEEIIAQFVIVADGLGGRSLDSIDEQMQLQFTVRRASRMGAGCLVPAALAPSWSSHVPDHEIAMHVGDGGYVGVVRLPDGDFDVAAALDPNAVRCAGGPATAMGRLLSECGVPGADDVLNQVHIRGTGRLTRQRHQTAASGLIVAGDAASYVEPFTGEGMTWAMVQGLHAGALAAEAVLDREAWSQAGERWMDWRQRVLTPRYRGCRLVQISLRSSMIRQSAMRLLNASAWARACVASTIRHGSRSYPVPSMGGAAWAS